MKRVAAFVAYMSIPVICLIPASCWYFMMPTAPANIRCAGFAFVAVYILASLFRFLKYEIFGQCKYDSVLQEALLAADQKETKFFVNGMEQKKPFDLIHFLAVNKGKYKITVLYEDVPEVCIKLTGDQDT